jgi:hypothetical protein
MNQYEFGLNSYCPWFWWISDYNSQVSDTKILTGTTGIFLFFNYLTILITLRPKWFTSVIINFHSFIFYFLFFF